MLGRPMHVPPVSRRFPAGPALPVALSFVLSVTCAVFVPIVFPDRVAAQAVVPFEPRFQTIARGDIAITGNTVLSCTDSPACLDVRQGVVDGDNSDFVMEWVDVDTDPTTFNSSTATVTVPAGGEVLHARLFWGGEVGPGEGGVPPPGANVRDAVRLATPASGGYVDVAADRLDVTGAAFQGVADVTALVAAGGSGPYTVADVQAATGAGRAGGWALVFVVTDPAEPLRSLTVFDGFEVLTTGDATDIVLSGFVTPPAGPVNARLGTIGWEGDRGLLGDSLQLEGTPLSNAVNPPGDTFNSTVSDTGVPVVDRVPADDNTFGVDADVFDATGIIPNGATSATVRLETTGEFFRPGAITSAIELFVPDLQTEAAKSFVDANGGPVTVGDELQFTIGTTNVGGDSAIRTVVTDPIPDGVSYVPGSLTVDGTPVTDAPGDDVGEFDPASRTITARVGVGADGSVGGVVDPDASVNVTFSVTVDEAALGQRIQNTASFAFFAETGGSEDPVEFELAPDTAAFDVVLVADLSVTKSADPTVYVAGEPLSYTIDVTNAGPTPVSGARLVDPPADVLGGVTWTCAVIAGTGSCGVPTGTGDVDVALDLAAAAVARVVVTGTVAAGASGTIENTATIEPPEGVVDPEPADNTATVETPGRSVADLAITKRFVDERFDPGSDMAFEIVVRNEGPDAVTGATVEDRLGEGLTPVEWACSAPGPPACRTELDGGRPTATLDLAPGTRAVLTLTASIDPRVEVQVTNLALVRPPEGVVDPDPSDDSVLIGGSVAPNVPPQLIGPIVVESGGESVVVIDPRDFVTDPEGFLDPAGISVTIDPAIGTATVDPETGVITIVLANEVVAGAPANGGTGPSEVSFTIEFCDPRGGCVTATATIRLTAIIAATGADLLPALVLGALLVAVGGAAVGLTRQRHTRP